MHATSPPSCTAAVPPSPVEDGLSMEGGGRRRKGPKRPNEAQAVAVRPTDREERRTRTPNSPASVRPPASERVCSCVSSVGGGRQTAARRWRWRPMTATRRRHDTALPPTHTRRVCLSLSSNSIGNSAAAAGCTTRAGRTVGRSVGRWVGGREAVVKFMCGHWRGEASRPMSETPSACYK